MLLYGSSVCLLRWENIRKAKFSVATCKVYFVVGYGDARTLNSFFHLFFWGYIISTAIISLKFQQSKIQENYFEHVTNLDQEADYKYQIISPLPSH